MQQAVRNRNTSLAAGRGQSASLAHGIVVALRWLAIVTTLVMVVVLLQGTLVTNTGSQAGCGDTWPLCHGKIIPEMSGVEGAGTMIEFSHRAVVPVASTLILALAAGALWLYRRRREIQLLAPLMIVFLFLQALLGGLAVMYPTSAPILALHFGISLISFASVLLTACFVLEIGGAETIRDRPITAGLKALIWGTFTFTYIVVYLGAYVRHVGASLACIDWPLCNNAVIPDLTNSYVAAQFIHRAGAAGLTVLIGALLWRTYRVRAQRPDLFCGAVTAMALVLLQAASGGIVIESRLAVLSTLLHSFLITLLFGTLSYLCYHSLRRPAAVSAT